MSCIHQYILTQFSRTAIGNKKAQSSWGGETADTLGYPRLETKWAKHCSWVQLLILAIHTWMQRKFTSKNPWIQELSFRQRLRQLNWKKTSDGSSENECVALNCTQNTYAFCLHLKVLTPSWCWNVFLPLSDGLSYWGRINLWRTCFRRITYGNSFLDSFQAITGVIHNRKALICQVLA